MLDTHYPQITDNKLNDVEISLQEPISKINLRGKSKEFFAKAGKVLSLILPNEANTSSFSENFNAIWLSPDEWMVYFKNDDEKVIFNKLYSEISKVNYGSVTDISDQWICINLKGSKIYDILSTGCSFNFDQFLKTDGLTTQTIVNHIDVILHNKNTYNINLFVRRSFSEHLCLWLNDSAKFAVSYTHLRAHET